MIARQGKRIQVDTHVMGSGPKYIELAVPAGAIAVTLRSTAAVQIAASAAEAGTAGTGGLPYAADQYIEDVPVSGMRAIWVAGASGVGTVVAVWEIE